MTSQQSSAETLLARLRSETAPWAGYSPSDPRDPDDLSDEEQSLFRTVLTAVLGSEVAEDDLPPLGSLSNVWTATADDMLTAWRPYQTEFQLSGSIPDHIVVAGLDTHLVNAASYSLDDGSALIVLNDALVSLYYEVSRILAKLVVFDGEPGRDGVPGNAGLIASGNATDDAGPALTSLLDWVRLSGHVHPIDIPLDGSRVRVAAALVHSIEEFVIAHEVAHLVLGHHGGCMGSRQLLIEVPASERGLDHDYRAEELDADSFAILMVLGLRAGRQERNDQAPPANSDPSLAIDAARLFFGLQSELERLVLSQHFPSALQVEHERTHPPADERASALLNAVRSAVENADEAWERSSSFTSAFGMLLEGSGDIVDREDEAQKWMERALSSCTRGGPIPDYTRFAQMMSTRAPRLQQPVMLAAIAAAMADNERTLAALNAWTPAGSVDAAPHLRNLQRFKLLLSVPQYLGIKALHALRSMYVHAGGSKLLDIIDHAIASALAPEDEDTPAARLLRHLGDETS
jgi:hypothetical protein